MFSSVDTYEQAIEYLFSRINYERVTSYSTSDFRLDRMREFLARLGNPQEKIPVVHVAGTKGKGSTAVMIAAALTASGYTTGLFTSPHISAFEERMAVDGHSPTPRMIVELVNSVMEAVTALDKMPGAMSPTYFEITTAMAWLYFVQQKARIAVLEVGLGGRLDATNVCRPEVTVITSISRDHTRQLGSRLSQIAREKAGILKPGVPVVSGATAAEALAVIESESRALDIPLHQFGRDFDSVYDAGTSTGAQGLRTGHVDVVTRSARWTDLPAPLVGEHQARNTALAIAAIERLIERGWKLTQTSVREGLGNLRWPARIEVLRRDPTVIVDAAHNWAAVAALLQTLDSHFPARRRILVFAATRDKDVSGMLRQLLPRFDSVILTCYQNNPRGVSAEELVRMVAALGSTPVHLGADTVSAWKLAKRIATPADLICVTGSFFIAAELRELILDDTRQDTIAHVSATVEHST